jgi:hypothetical protein
MTNFGIHQASVGIQRKCGALVSAQELSQMLGYRTVGALHQARRRGQLGIKLHKIPNRRGMFAFSEDVIRWFNELRTTGLAGDIAPSDVRGRPS